MKSFDCKRCAIPFALLSLGSGSVFAAPPTSGAYTTDQTQSYVEDATSQGIRLPNTVLCYMNGTGANQSAVLNDGDYIALVDKNKCENASGAVNNSASGNAGASSAPDYMTGIINATRTNDSSPLIGKVWFLENAMNGPGGGTTTGIIYAKLTATSAPTTAEPYGHFHTDFCGLPTGQTTCTLGSARFFGYAEGSGAAVSAFQDGDQQVSVTLSGTVDSGSGRVKFGQGGTSYGDWAFRFDATYFHRADNGTSTGDPSDQCFARDSAQAERTAWSYGVYNADGSRLQRSSGFPIKTAAGDNGYVGYWGMWLPAGVVVNNGDTVTSFSYGSNSSTSASYTLVKIDGRLKKQDLHTNTLAGIANVPFMWWVDHNFTDSNGVPRSVGDSLEVRWDGSSFRITGSMTPGSVNVTPDSHCAGVTNGSYSMNGCADITSELQNGWNVSGWSQSLGGQVTIVTRNTSTGASISLGPNTVVTYRTETVLQPGGSGWPAGSLYCVSNCPAGGTAFTNGLNTNGGNPFESFSGGGSSQWNWMPVAGGSEIAYTANATTGLLETGGASVAWSSSNAPGNSQFNMGFQSGRMVDATGLASLACDASGGNSATDHSCPNRLDGVQTVYVWETGANSWNKFTGLKSGSSYVQFDPPLQLSYAVPSGVATFGSTTLVLQYNGFGDLQGIPGKCVNPVTNAEVQCDPNGNTRWVAAFVIPADSTVSDGTTTYYVKPLQEELRLAKVADSYCSGLTLPTIADNALPGVSSWTDPHVAIGAQPTLPTTAPRVIDGVVQY